MPDVIVEQGHRQGSKLFHIGDGFYYHCNRRRGNTLSLRCIYYYSKGCLARATCQQDYSNFRRYENTNRHYGHERDISLPAVLKLRRNILERCIKKDPSHYVDIVENESEGFSDKARAMNTAVRLRSAMRRARLKNLPKVPEDMSGLHKILASERYRHLSKTKSGSSLMYAGRCGTAANKTRCLIFMSKKMRSAMKTSRTVFSDSTWDGRPAKPKSSQLFSMCTTWDSQIIPLVFALMESKNQKTYEGLYNAIQTIVPTFDPHFWHVDHESAQYQAAKIKFPRCRMVGCLYHYSSNVSRKAKKLGYTADINGSHTFFSIVRSTLAIPLVRSDQLVDALSAVMIRAGNVLYYDKLRPLLSYIYEEYIMKRGDILSVAGCDNRTSNVEESLHAKVQRVMVARRPNVFQFIDGLLKLEDRSRLDIYCMLRSVATNRGRKVSAISNDKTIKTLTRRLCDGHLNMSRFLRYASYTLMAPFRRVFPEETDEEDDDDDDDSDHDD